MQWKSLTLCCIVLLCAGLTANASSCGWPADEMTNSTPVSKASMTNLTGFATWYSRESCKLDDKIRKVPPRAEFLMANGKPLNDATMTCAAWNTKLGQQVRVTNLETKATVLLTVTDRGPGRSSRRRGVIIDLTPAAFLALGGKLRDGKIKVKIEAI